LFTLKTIDKHTRTIDIRSAGSLLVCLKTGIYGVGICGLRHHCGVYKNMSSLPDSTEFTGIHWNLLRCKTEIWQKTY